MERSAKMKKNILYITIIVSFVIISVFVVFAKNNITTKLYIDPQNIISKKINVGGTFTVNVGITDVTDLKGYEFRLKYNKNILNATHITSSTFLSSSLYCVKRMINNTEGIIWIACMMPLNSETSVGGSGTLETITFKVMNKGESNIEFYKTVLGDNTGKTITHSIENGYFTNLRNK